LSASSGQTIDQATGAFEDPSKERYNLELQKTRCMVAPGGSMSAKRWNWRLWVGLLASFLAVSLFLRLFAETRSIFWVSLALFILAGALLISGLKRAWSEPGAYRGRMAGPLLVVLSAIPLAVFAWASYEVMTKMPAARNAPRVGQKAPEFALTDASGATMTLARALTTPMKDSSGQSQTPKGVLLVFYRGYW